MAEHHLEFLKEAALARLSLHLSKCHIVGNHMSPLICMQDRKTAHNRLYLFVDVTRTKRSCSFMFGLIFIDGKKNMKRLMEYINL